MDPREHPKANIFEFAKLGYGFKPSKVIVVTQILIFLIIFQFDRYTSITKEKLKSFQNMLNHEPMLSSIERPIFRLTKKQVS